MSEYLLFAFGDPGTQSRVVDGFVGAPGGQPTDGVFAPLREVRYDVAQHDVWRLVPEWSTREEIDPAAFIEDDRHHDVMVMVYDPAGPGGFMTEHGAAHRWQALMRDVARVITAHTTVRARFVPALSVAPLR